MNKKVNKLVDNRIQKRRIIIDFEKIGYDYKIDDYIDNIIVDLKTVILQREDDNISIKITLE